MAPNVCVGPPTAEADTRFEGVPTPAVVSSPVVEAPPAHDVTPFSVLPVSVRITPNSVVSWSYWPVTNWSDAFTSCFANIGVFITVPDVVYEVPVNWSFTALLEVTFHVVVAAEPPVSAVTVAVEVSVASLIATDCGWSNVTTKTLLTGSTANAFTLIKVAIDAASKVLNLDFSFYFLFFLV